MKANKFYMVAPFLQPLKRWTNEQKKRTTLTAPETSHEQYLTDDGLLVASAALEETLQQQRDQHVLDVQTPTNNSSNHLMALLGHRLQVEVTQPSFGVTSPADDGAADRLKQLLSVGQAQSIIEHHQNMAPRATNTNAVDLLAMLRQGSTSSGPPPQAAARPKTPLDQVTNTAHKPRRLSQHRTRTSEASPLRGATPDLPFSPARMAQQQQYQNSGSQSGQPPPIWAVPQFPQSAKAYEHNRDPPIARESISLASGPMVPSASQLPAPKLSTHHMSLLDAFKNGPQPSAAQRSQSFQVPQHAVSKSPAANPLLALFKGNAVQQPSNIVTTQKPRAHQALAQAPAPMPLRQAQTPQVVPAATLSGQRPNTHKDSLLSLFRTPSANAPQVVEALDSAPRSQVIRAEVALAPLTKPGNVQILSRKEKMTEENTLPVRVNMNSTATTPIAAPSSAKNIDLLNTPEIGTVRRKPRPKSPARDSPGLSDSSLGNAAATRNLKRNGRTNVGNLPVDQRPMPTQILKRPTPAASQVHTPTQSPEKEPMKPAVVKVETRITLKPTVVKTEVKPTTPKTFQPQILRRPQDASPAVPLELPTSITPKVAPPEAAIDKTEVLMSMFKQASIGSQTAQPPSLAPAGEALVLPADQKNTLLSLFAKPTIPASAMPPPRKPISPPITRPQTLSRPSSMRTDHQASLLSLFGQPKPTPTINASGQAVPSMVASPTSILSFGSNVRPGTPSSNITALKRGSISSVLSGQGEVRPRINSMTSRDGAPTPISTTDRGFLLNYLKGI
jgi:mRNA-decapping enzyme subunit 2